MQRARVGPSPLGGTSAGMVQYCCSGTFLDRHIAFSDESATDKAVAAMKNLQNRDICSVLVLTEDEARALYLAVLTWRSSGLGEGDYWLKATFSRCIEAKMSGVKLWTGAIEIKVGFDGEKLVHLADMRGGSG